MLAYYHIRTHSQYIHQGEQCTATHMQSTVFVCSCCLLAGLAASKNRMPVDRLWLNMAGYRDTGMHGNRVGSCLTFTLINALLPVVHGMVCGGMDMSTIIIIPLPEACYSAIGPTFGPQIQPCVAPSNVHWQ